MKMLLPLLLLLAQSRDTVVEKIIREGTEDNRVMDHMDHLVNRIGPRLTSSTNLTKACEWARDRLASWGLEASLEEWGSFPVGFDRGPWSAKMVEPEERTLMIGTHSWTAGTDGPVTGPAILAPAKDDELKAVKEKLKGAWVISTSKGAEKYWVAYEEAGAAGVIRSTGSELIHTGGNPKIQWDKLPSRVSVNMAAGDHRRIVDHLQAGRKVTLTIDIRNTFVKGPVPQYNVIADLRGSEHPDEYVLVGGHIDSWDGSPGTTDNATGVAAAMEAARLLARAGARPKRTIRFALWGGEEQGLLGSRAYVRKHPELLPKISAVIVHDGGTNQVSGISATEAIYPHFQKAFAPVLDLPGELKFQIQKVKGLPRGGGSDHASFTAAGVPGFYLRQSRTAAKGQNYSHEHHTQHDTFDVAIPEFMRHAALVLALGSLGIADLDVMLPRDNLLEPPSARLSRRRMLGVQCDEDLVIQEIVEGSSAEKAGLKPGDRILRIAGKEVGDLAGLRREIQAADRESKVVVRREEKEVEIPVTFSR